MKPQFPPEADPIYVEWVVKEGGIQAAAWTDHKRVPYLAVKILNRIGHTTGLYDWQRRRRLLSDFVVGFAEDRPLVVRARVTVTAEGITMIVTLPPDAAKTLRGFIKRRFAAWGSGAPIMNLTIIPRADHYAAQSFPTE